MSRCIRYLFALYLIYHLFAILTMPLLSSILGRRLGQYITPYTNTIGLNPSWEFFSPDPPVPLYFDYTIYFEDENGGDVSPPIDGVFPEGGLEPTNHPNKIRLKTSVRLLALNEGKTDSVFINYLCRKYPNATRVTVVPIVEIIPPLEKVIASGGNIETKPLVIPPMDKTCREVKDETNI